jgi:hypothetical protein
MILHRFAHCELRIFPETHYVETLFPDGTRAGATRECEVGNAVYAAHLGYTDCWLALVEHEIGHTLVSMALGHRWSPTLQAVAHKYAPGTAPYEEQLAEEAVVLQLQRFSRTGAVGWALRHREVRPHFSRWARDLRALAARLLAQQEEAA